MQKIRSINANDFRQIEEIHKQFYADQFTLPDFIKNYICAFVIEDEGEILVAGGVRAIAESVIMTNKNTDIKGRREALYNMLTAVAHVTKLAEYDQVHAFIQDDKWKHHLINVGFRPTKGQALYLDLK